MSRMSACHDHFSARDPMDLVLERDLAKRWDKSLRTLQRWRAEGYGPPHVRVGGTIHYRVKDVLAFEEHQTQGGSSL
ncbi:helix-turn-helix domain-containing protein [Thetidibacter halocola]|uniref:helix-turn-helix domain-containing protein n=1 Tax=Thetidibacter halocola TaxID=2827239 RepID=UPI0031FEE6F8